MKELLISGAQSAFIMLGLLTWYRNEMGYTYTLVEHVIKAGRLV